MVDTVETAIYRLRTEGKEQVDQLRASVDLLIKSDGTLERQNEAASRSFQRRIAALDPGTKVQQQYNKNLEYQRRLLEEGVGTQAQHAAFSALINKQYVEGAAALGKFKGANDNVTASLKPARFELINLSRQIQDVGVSLSGGQSPFQVLIQQGTQIADIMAASNASVGSFFRTSIGWAGRFITSTAGVTTGLVGMGAAAAYMASSWVSSQKDIERALSGVGARSGATVQDVNKFAEATAAAGRLSVSESRSAALEFVKTGNIYKENIHGVTALVYGFSKSIGESSEEAAKQLAKIFGGEVVAGAEKLGETYAFLSGRVRENIRALEVQGRRQEAIKVLVDAVTPSTERAAQTTGFWAASWEKVANFASNAADAIGRALAKGTGVGLGPQDRLQQNTARQSQLQGEIGRLETPLAGGAGVPLMGDISSRRANRALKELRDEMEKLREEQAKLNAEIERGRLNKLSVDADNVTRSLLPAVAQVEELDKGLQKIRDAQLQGAPRGMGGYDKQATDAAIANRILLEEQAAAADRVNQITLQIAANERNVGVEVAKTLIVMQGQIEVAGAVTGAEKIRAQEVARTVELYLQGKTLVEATAIAAAEREAHEAAATAAVEEQVHALEQSTDLIKARLRGIEATVKAEQAYENAIRSGASAAAASELARAVKANERAKAEEVAARAAERHAEAAARAAERYERMAATLKFLPFQLLDVMGMLEDSSLFNSKQGGKSQFNPQGYQFSFPIPINLKATGQFGEGGFSLDSSWANGYVHPQDVASIVPNSQGLEFMTNKTLASGGVQSAINQLQGYLTNDKTSSGAASLLSQLTEFLPKDQQVSAINQQLNLLKTGPQNLATMSLIEQLNQKLEGLTRATEENTSATQSMTDVLSPFYSSDPRRTHLGFRAFATGGVAMSETYARIAENEPEVVAPLSQLPAILAGIGKSGAANSNQPIVIKQTVNVYGNVTADQARKTGFQLAQSQRRELAR